MLPLLMKEVALSNAMQQRQQNLATAAVVENATMEYCAPERNQKVDVSATSGTPAPRCSSKRGGGDDVSPSFEALVAAATLVNENEDGHRTHQALLRSPFKQRETVSNNGPVTDPSARTEGGNNDKIMTTPSNEFNWNFWMEQQKHAHTATCDNQEVAMDVDQQNDDQRSDYHRDYMSLLPPIVYGMNGSSSVDGMSGRVDSTPGTEIARSGVINTAGASRWINKNRKTKNLPLKKRAETKQKFQVRTHKTTAKRPTATFAAEIAASKKLFVKSEMKMEETIRPAKDWTDSKMIDQMLPIEKRQSEEASAREDD